MTMNDLKQQKRWIVWRYEIRKGKKTKVPYSAHGTTTGTNPPYAHSWVTYDEATRSAQEHGWDGVGFIIPEGCFFLDIDHKDINDPYVQMMLERFGSYAEYSVSGGGIHIYGCDTKSLE